MPTALIAEDEPMLRAQLKSRLADAWPELAIIAEAANGADALASRDLSRATTLAMRSGETGFST